MGLGVWGKKKWRRRRCHHGGTDGRRRQKGKIELLSQWTMEGWDEQIGVWRHSIKKLLIQVCFWRRRWSGAIGWLESTSMPKVRKVPSKNRSSKNIWPADRQINIARGREWVWVQNIDRDFFGRHLANKSETKSAYKDDWGSRRRKIKTEAQEE